jgi:hypothetical protein
MSPLRLFRAANLVKLNGHLRGGKRGRRACEIPVSCALMSGLCAAPAAGHHGVRIVSGTNLPGVLEAQLFSGIA